MNYLTRYYKNLSEQLQEKIDAIKEEIAILEGKSKHKKSYEEERVEKIQAKDRKKKLKAEEMKDAEEEED